MVLMLPLPVHVWLPVCRANNHQFVVSKASSFHFTVSFWMIFNIQGNPAVPRYEYACLFFGIYSFNGLERDAISHIFPLPCFGRYEEAFACVCVCVGVYVCTSFFLQFWQAFLHFGRLINTNYYPTLSHFPLLFHLGLSSFFLSY